ncbi:MAG: sulfotransferase [Proteobacteria bacterium]|nr:sulfotransferase [Pseudomonadota bacterium]
MKSCPIIVLAPVWRSGSTLVQRILNTGDDLVVWGENHGIVSHFAGNLHELKRYQKRGIDGKAFREFNKNKGRKSANLWLANTNPPPECYLSSARDFLESYYVLDNRRWGFKEVRYGKKEIDFLDELFPNARYVFIVRDILDCYRSTKTLIPYEIQNIGGMDGFVRKYENDVECFVRYAEKQKEKSLLIRYEDFNEDTVSLLCSFSEIEESDYSHEVFRKKISGVQYKIPLMRYEIDKLLSLKSRRILGYYK